jgi:hypothetical protein
MAGGFEENPEPLNLEPVNGYHYFSFYPVLHLVHLI